MLAAKLLLLLSAALAEQTPKAEGEIKGVVVNASQDRAPCAETEVILRVQHDGQFVPVDRAIADARGRFRFKELPLGKDFLYLPGANRADIHYPGPRVQLSGRQPSADITLEVCDTVDHPSPLVIKRHDVLLRTESGALHVTEFIRLANPSNRTYVGKAAKEGDVPVTLRLSVPPDFDRTTFFKEFYGRQFAIADGQLVTGIPWTPGERDLKFMYTLRNEARRRLWERPFDLPCEQVEVRIQADHPDEITCNLEPAHGSKTGERVFSSKGQLLPAGFVLRAQLGRMPIPWTTYARWISLGLLVSLIAGTAWALLGRNRGRSATGQSSAAEKSYGAADARPGKERPAGHRR